jgi:hypothetical protein
MSCSDINYWTRKQFEDLPFRPSWDEELKCDSIIVLPLRRKHDSGYRVMDFVAVVNGMPICRLSGCSDVLHIDGIGGLGYNWLEEYHKVPDKVIPSGWSMDCLLTSGLMRFFPSFDRHKGIIAGMALSSFEIFVDPK